MEDIRSCPVCGVPRRFIDTHAWLAGGILVQRDDPQHRFALIEADNLDPLYGGIEAIIGAPIERLVIDTKRRATRQYMTRLIPPDIKDLVLEKKLGVEPMIEALNATGNVMGYGVATLAGYRLELDDDDFITERVEEPYSVPLWCGDLAGSAEAVIGRDLDVEYAWVSQDTIEITSRLSSRPQPEEMMQIEEPAFVAEGMELERCPTCGGPYDLCRFEWHPEKGIIRSRETGRRLALVGPTYQQVIYDELERELGETIPRAILEVQRRFAKMGYYDLHEIEDEEGFRRQLALRGLGELQELRLSGGRIAARIKNAAMPLMIVGLMQGYLEVATNADSYAEWEMGDDGILDVDITTTA